MAAKYFIGAMYILSLILLRIECKNEEKSKEKTKIGKDVQDYTESDIYRLLDQWDENDDDFDPEDYDDTDPRKPPPPQPNIDPSKLKDDPMAFMKMAKKGKTLMLFVQVSPKLSNKKADQITGLWQQSLFNAQFQIQRYMVGENRAIFMLQDGSNAWDVKEFLIKQPDCLSVEFDNQKYPGLAAQNEKTEL